MTSCCWTGIISLARPNGAINPYKKNKPDPAPLTKKTRSIAEILVQIGIQFGSVLWQRAYWYDRLTLAHAALNAAKLLSDWKSVSTFARNISWIYFYQGDYLRALHWAEEALSATQKRKMNC